MSDQQGLYTLAEASELTGLSTEALRLRIKRGKMASERGNDGQPRVRITEAERADFRRLLARRQSTLTRQDANNDNPANMLEAAAAALHERAAKAEAERNAAKAEAAAERERADKAEARAGQAKAEREAARIAAARAEGEATALREQVKAERGRAELARDAATAQVQAAEAARDGARAELADWTVGGPLGRAWRALIYWRGRP